MNNFKNNPRRHRFRSNNDRNFKKRNGNGHKLNGDFNNNPEFKRKNPGRNNQNAAKLIEKYNDLAREAQSNGDKILSENYLQHADHFARILNSQEQTKVVNLNTNSSEQNSEEKVDQVVTESDDKKIKEEIKAVDKLRPAISSDFNTSILILFTSNSFLCLPFKVFPDGNFNF